MNQAAFGEMLSVVDDAINLAESAVKSAESAIGRRPEPVTLVKVAADRYSAVADKLLKTAALPEFTRESLTKFLEESGPNGLLECLEKLASRAVFSLSTDDVSIGGNLVDKSATTWVNSKPEENERDTWYRACVESDLL